MADEQDRNDAEDEAEEAEEERDEAPSASDEPAPKKSAKAEAEDEDEDEGEGEGAPDEEEEEEEEAPPPPKKSSATRAAVEARPKRRRPETGKAVLPPEREIAAPSRQTLIMLGAMAGATLLMWGSARFACNAHPAQTRKPREVSTAELSRDPKDAALELQQRWNSYDFKGALELAKGSIAEELQKAQGECDKNAADCESKRKALEDQALATAALLSRGPGSAKVRVVSRGGAGGDQTVVYTLEQEGSSWKVNGRGTADPTPAPAPTPAPTPAPSGSAAPAPSAGH